MKTLSGKKFVVVREYVQLRNGMFVAVRKHLRSTPVPVRLAS